MLTEVCKKTNQHIFTMQKPFPPKHLLSFQLSDINLAAVIELDHDGVQIASSQYITIFFFRLSVLHLNFLYIYFFTFFLRFVAANIFIRFSLLQLFLAAPNIKY